MNRRGFFATLAAAAAGIALVTRGRKRKAAPMMMGVDWANPDKSMTVWTCTYADGLADGLTPCQKKALIAAWSKHGPITFS